MIYVVGQAWGPDGNDKKGFQVLKRCQVIIGYSGYLDLIRDYFPHKKLLSTPMQREVERCRKAYATPKRLRCGPGLGGDAGVYGMAGVLMESVVRPMSMRKSSRRNCRLQCRCLTWCTADE